MSKPPTAPAATVLRLSRYHCFLGELQRSAEPGLIRSREIADELGLSEETVRHDLSFVAVKGRSGAGYDPSALFEAIQAFLDLSALHPFFAIGNTDILRGLTITFPAADFGMRPVAYFSERPEDVGMEVDGLPIQALSAVATTARESGATIALVACEPAAVDSVLENLSCAGIKGVLMLTPVLRPTHPASMDVTYFRIPCSLKALAGAEPAASTPSCCGSNG